jgi:hypothetical protein
MNRQGSPKPILLCAVAVALAFSAPRSAWSDAEKKAAAELSAKGHKAIHEARVQDALEAKAANDRIQRRARSSSGSFPPATPREAAPGSTPIEICSHSVGVQLYRHAEHGP